MNKMLDFVISHVGLSNNGQCGLASALANSCRSSMTDMGRRGRQHQRDSLGRRHVHDWQHTGLGDWNGLRCRP